MDARKSYPENYPDDVVKVLEALTIPGGRLELAGSSALRSMQYAADFDAIESVKANSLTPIAKNFQRVIRRLQAIPRCFVADIKCGSIEEWKVIPDSAKIVRGRVVGYHGSTIRNKIMMMRAANVLTDEEANKGLRLARDTISLGDFLVLRDLIRPHVIRWSPSEVLRGSKRLADGRTISLLEALQTRALCKIDAIAWVAGNHFTDFSCIYSITVNGESYSPPTNNYRQSIEEDILALTSEGNWFKALKRHFSLARYDGNEAAMRRLLPILNGDLGRIYSLISDIDTLLYLLTHSAHVSLDDMRFEMEQFKGRLGGIWETPGFLKIEPAMLSRIRAAISTTSRTDIVKNLSAVQASLAEVLEKYSPR